MYGSRQHQFFDQKKDKVVLLQLQENQGEI